MYVRSKIKSHETGLLEEVKILNSISGQEFNGLP